MSNRAVIAVVVIVALLVLAYMARSPDVVPALAPEPADAPTAAQSEQTGPEQPAPAPLKSTMEGHAPEAMESGAMEHGAMEHGAMAGGAAEDKNAEAMTSEDMAEGEMNGEHGGHDMSSVNADAAPIIPEGVQGNRPLEPKIVDGVKVFDLTARVVQWHILPDVKVAAYVYNDQLPGPQLRVRPGEKLRINFKNELPEPTTIHWHGLILDNAMDGVPFISQPPVQPGGTFVYEFAAPDSPGTFFYHTHFAADRQDILGLHGAFVVEDVQAPAKYAVDQLILLNEHRVVGGKTYPAMDFDNMLPNYFSINGKSFPSTQSVKAKVGDKVLFRFVGSGQFIHPMHIHGGPFEIIATDGYPVPPGARLTKDTVLIGPGERYDVVWTARKPGKWLMHCHITHHLTNDGKEVMGAGGLTTVIEVSP